MEQQTKAARPRGTDSVVVGYRIKRGSPDCGRDKNGVFRCICGRCEALGPDVNHDCGNRGNNCSDSGDNGDCGIYDESP